MIRHLMNARSAKSLPRVMAADRRRAAMHESGHVVMAIYLGCLAEARVYRTQTTDTKTETTFIGQTKFFGRATNDEQSIRLIAVAGMVAERLWVDGLHENYTDGWTDHLHEPESISATDCQLGGCLPDELQEVTEVVAGLFMGDLWPVITAMSRVLMKSDRWHCFAAEDLTRLRASHPPPRRGSRPWLRRAA